MENNRPVIAGYEVVTALGNLDATWNGLMAGQSGLRPLNLPGVPNAYPAGYISSLGDEYGSAQRLTDLLELGFKNLPCVSVVSDNCDIIVATTKGAADELLQHPDKPAGQPWHIKEIIAEITGCRGQQHTMSAACASGTVALIQAAKQIISGRSKCVLVVGIDLLSSFVMAGFDALKGLSQKPCRPFDRNRDGLSLGEGVGIVLLCSEAHAAENNLEAVAGIMGWGVSCDATHITAPSRTASGLLRVIEQAARNQSVRIGAVNAHGTGTVYNDAMEMTAFTTFWDDPPPFHSVKGSIGHCLGAAGVIEAAVAIRSLQENHIPPSVGYREGNVPDGRISGSAPLSLTHPTILACNSGFGGINAGIIFSGA